MKTSILYLIILIIISSGCKSAHCQLSNGLYYGGDYNEGSNGIGYYWLYNDSSFIMVAQLKDDSIARHVGFGTWKFSKEHLLFKYKQIPFKNLYAGHVFIKSASEAPFDSILIEGDVSIGDSLASFASLFFVELGSSMTSDAKGRFKGRISNEKSFSTVRFTSLNAHPMEVEISDEFNFHDIKVNLVPNSAPYVESIKPKEKMYKYINKNGETLQFANGFNVKRIDNSSNQLKRLISQNVVKNPLSQKLLQWLHSLIVVE